jgi:hypothetical protein
MVLPQWRLKQAKRCLVEVIARNRSFASQSTTSRASELSRQSESKRNAQGQCGPYLNDSLNSEL